MKAPGSAATGCTLTLSSTSAAAPSFAAPATLGALVFSLTVNDGVTIRRRTR